MIGFLFLITARPLASNTGKLRLVIAFGQGSHNSELRNVVIDKTNLLTVCVRVCVYTMFSLSRLCYLLVWLSRTPSFLGSLLKGIYLRFTEPCFLLLERVILGEEERTVINKQFLEAVITAK